ncbi:MAG: ribosomal protein S18-alanine N-acetyltransferase [Pyrinomonadaceae bacterium]
MAVLETIRNFFVPTFGPRDEVVVPAAPTTYDIRPLTLEQLPEVLRLNIRCFCNGDNYTKYTFEYLLNEPRSLSYRVVTPAGEMVAFAFVMVNENNAAHLTTIGVAPEHRRRRIAARLMRHVERSLQSREVTTVMLEVRVSNTEAQELYRRAGYMVVQRISKYYNNGEDCFLMIKALFSAPSY